MAKIDIEKKNNNNSNIWMWILGLLVIAGIIWWIAGSGDDEPEVEETAVYEQRISANLDVEKADQVNSLETEILSFA